MHETLEEKLFFPNKKRCSASKFSGRTWLNNTSSNDPLPCVFFFTVTRQPRPEIHPSINGMHRSMPVEVRGRLELIRFCWDGRILVKCWRLFFCWKKLWFHCSCYLKCECVSVWCVVLLYEYHYHSTTSSSSSSSSSPIPPNGPVQPRPDQSGLKAGLSKGPSAMHTKRIPKKRCSSWFSKVILGSEKKKRRWDSSKGEWLGDDEVVLDGFYGEGLGFMSNLLMYFFKAKKLSTTPLETTHQIILEAHASIRSKTHVWGGSLQIRWVVQHGATLPQTLVINSSAYLTNSGKLSTAKGTRSV